MPPGIPGMPGMGPERRPVSSGCSAPGKTRRETRKDPERPGKARYHFVQSDLLPPASMLNRYIYYALLRAAIAQINVKLSLRCAECMLKQDSQNCTSQSVHPDYPYCALLRACCFTSATTMDQWSISWSSSSTSHAHSLLNIHLEL